MAVGSHLAGRAIDISKTTAAHALSYGITSRYRVSHGHAAALTLGAFIEEHSTADPSRLHRSVEVDAFAAAMESILRALGADSGAAARERLIALMNDIGLATRLSAITAALPDAAARLAASVNVERLGNNPVRFNADELERIVRTAV